MRDQNRWNIRFRLLFIYLVTVLALISFSSKPAMAETIHLLEDGEGLANGTPMPGWIPVDPPLTIATAITLAANPAAIHSGLGAIRINGDFGVGRYLDSVATGIVTIDYWHFPQPGTSTNSFLKLYTGMPGESDELFTIHKNDQDKWWVDSNYVADYTGSYTHVTLRAYTEQGLCDVWLNGSLVADRWMVANPEAMKKGIAFVLFHSGRSGDGTDSYIDDLKVSSISPVPEPSTILLFGSGLVSTWLIRRRGKHRRKA